MLVQRVVERHDGHDVERADVRMDAVVRTHVDPLHRDRGGRDQPLSEAAGRAAGREDGAVVVDIDVHVQYAGPPHSSASPRASTVRGSRPSLKFGTVSSGSTGRSIGGLWRSTPPTP